MRNFNPLSALWRAPLFHKPLFEDVGLRWRGIGLLFLLLLLLVTWLPPLIKWTVGFSHFVDADAPAALADFPPITISHGKASSPVAQPYLMKDSAGKPIFVRDTTGATTKPSDLGARILLTDSELIQDNQGRVEHQQLTNLPDMKVDSATLLRWLRNARNWFLPLGLVLLVAGSLVYRLILALVFGGIAMAINSGMKGALTFPGAMRLAIVSMTAPLLIQCLLDLAGLSLGCTGWFLFLGLTLGYLVFGVKAVADAAPAEIPTISPAPPTGPDALFP